MTINDVRREDKWRGLRFIILVRQSDDSQGSTSTEAQLQWLRAEGERLGMVLVDEIILNGVTGSLPGKRDDLPQLLDRKRDQDDFDVLVVQRLDRLTRGGTSHGFWIDHEFEKAGITILATGDDLPEDGRYGGLIKAAKYDAAREQARSIGQRSVQGMMHAIKQGRNCVASRTSYGCDRLYLTSDGKPSFVIRNLADGRQHKLTHDKNEIIDTLGQAGGGVKGHYRKQKDEHVLIVPGEDVKVGVVRDIFDLHYNQHWGGKRIADLLNRRGIRSPAGKGWSQRQVESIYENPIYCGVALGQRISQGIYYKRGEQHPEAVNLDAKTLANCHVAPKQHRPPTEWLWQDQPLMKDFLPEPVAVKARQEIEKVLLERWQRRQDPTQPTRSTNKHKNSAYILTGLLFAKQDGEDLSGVMCGNEGHRKRYYRNRKANATYCKGSVLNRLISAEALETAVVKLLRNVLLDAPMLRERVLQAIADRPSTDASRTQLAEAQRERDAIAKRVQLIFQTFDDADLADAKPVLKGLNAQGRALEHRIAELTRALEYVDADSAPEELADRVIERLSGIDAQLPNLPAVTLRNVLRAFVERIEVDMASKNAAVSLRLPPWALHRGDLAMCLAPSSASPTGHETHQHDGLVIHLTHADCRYVHTRGSTTVPPCYDCRRRAA
ncbi:recombinase family protein [Phycisphaerales bacterium AB-hyl4]|uniref:Recombinase family protein n=1 Tax=Natronomicrosphaera hydrolytica TaxID=3242702 RepID=A0ABV4U373_9BACT